MDSRVVRDPLAIASRFGWDIVWTVAGFIALGLVLRFLSSVILPVVLALFGASLLSPFAAHLARRGAKPSLASLGALLAGVAILTGVLLLAIIPFARNIGSIADTARQGVGSASELANKYGLLDPAQAEQVRTKALSYADDIAAAFVW